MDFNQIKIACYLFELTKKVTLKMCEGAQTLCMIESFGY